jgi:hypothetical protein
MHDLYACLPFKPGFATCILLQCVHMWPCSHPLRMRSTYDCRAIDSFLFYLMQALPTRIAWQNIVTNPMQSQQIIASYKVTTPCWCCDEAGHCSLLKAGPCSTWPQVDILLAVAAALLLRIEPLPTPKSNPSCYRLKLRIHAQQQGRPLCYSKWGLRITWTLTSFLLASQWPSISHATSLQG